MLKTRILTAIILISLVLAALFGLDARAWGTVTLVITGVAAGEWARLAAFDRGSTLAFVAITVITCACLLMASCGRPRCRAGMARIAGPRSLRGGDAVLAQRRAVLAVSWLACDLARCVGRGRLAGADRDVVRHRPDSGAVAGDAARADGDRLDRRHRGLFRRASLWKTASWRRASARARRGKACTAR